VFEPCLRSFGGEINKLFMFDKGCTFLAAFGLPGKKNEREAAFALQCASLMSKTMPRQGDNNDYLQILKRLTYQ
jgi:adenylate cyclase 10